MRNRWMGAVCMAGLSWALSGCTALLVGAGAVGGYAVGKDSVTTHLEFPKEEVFRQALEVAQEMGEVTREAPKQGTIRMKIGDVSVRITVRQITEKVSQLSVKARSKFLMPQVDTAQEVFAKIVKRLSVVE